MSSTLLVLKLYDANTNALASAITLSNLASTETLVDSGTASTSSANAGSYTINNLTGISIADGTNGGLVSNYTLTGGTHSFYGESTTLERDVSETI